MEEFKIRQILYNRLHTHDDLISGIPHKIETDRETVIQRAIEYFTKNSVDISFPAKSYAVALIYAHLLEKHFAKPFFESLSDADLFCGNDLYFKPYTEDADIYDEILKAVPIKKEPYQLPLHLNQVFESHAYFLREFDLPDGVQLF